MKLMRGATGKLYDPEVRAVLQTFLTGTRGAEPRRCEEISSRTGYSTNRTLGILSQLRQYGFVRIAGRMSIHANRVLVYELDPENVSALIGRLEREYPV